ncbi:MAG: o-succinylbenzoate synthase [Bryobacteraceae bacterium]|nr:o-succinylbenzoate synthase [Bryobacteraceae bacterium]MDW8376917.1 o-succinylbenzoate synthase [Bryobacterales bacterium]
MRYDSSVNQQAPHPAKLTGRPLRRTSGSRSMILERIVLTHVRIPLVEPFRISSGAVAVKDAIVVRIETNLGVGFGESSPMAGSFYSSDTPESCWRELCEQVVPALLSGEFASPLEAARTASTLPVRNFAKVGVETAFWDLAAQQDGTPLCVLLGGAIRPVPSGLAVGLYDDPADLLRAIERYLPAGYQRVKIKIEPGRDVDLVRQVRRHFGSIPLLVDANGAYNLSQADVFRRLDEFDLLMFEQPFPAGSLSELAELQRQVRTPVCLDESLDSLEQLRAAIGLGSVRIANIKIQRVGGFTQAVAMANICREHNLPFWIGTMPELGIGQAQGLALATIEGCAFPTDVEASLRWFCDDLIEPLIELQDGYLLPSSAPGLGFSVDVRKLKRYTVAEQVFPR